MADYTGYETIYDYCSVLESGHHTITLANSIQIPVEVIRIESNLSIDNNYLTSTSFGDGIEDTEMLILISEYDITVEKDTVLCPAVRKKGFVIYCNGTLTNNGTISMTARGAKGDGEDVLLYKNDDDTYEFIPAIGGAGGPSAVMSYEGRVPGLKSADGINRQTGGGASGSAFRGASYAYTVRSGAGGAGTSYSGGAGGGGISARERNWTGYSGSSAGGAGGNGLSNYETRGYCGGGGAGNPGGVGNYQGSANANYSGKNGTGGLLIIYANTYINNGTVSADGVEGGLANTRVPASGGSSGGGSVNIFYSEMINAETSITTANGGAAQAYGGCAGANGCVTFTQIDFIPHTKNKYVSYHSFIRFMRQYTRKITGGIDSVSPYEPQEIIDMVNNLWG